MISKELLSEVYNTEADIVKLVFNETSKLVVYRDNQIKDKLFPVNIYELAHKCKEWAYNKGYELRNGRDIDVKEELCYFCEYKQEGQLDYSNGDYFLADNDSESIFKACQWILDSKKERN